MQVSFNPQLLLNSKQTPIFENLVKPLIAELRYQPCSSFWIQVIFKQESHIIPGLLKTFQFYSQRFEASFFLRRQVPYLTSNHGKIT